MLPLHSTIKTLAFGLFLPIVFASCYTNSNKNIEIIKALNESIESSNRILAAETTEVLMTLKSKLDEPGSEERAKVWLPKAEKIQQISKDLFDYIEELKRKVKDSSINSSKLFQRLTNYKNEILEVNPKITSQYEKSLKIFTHSFDSSRKAKEILFQEYFKNESIEATVAMLNKLQNNVKNNELRIVSFCNEHVGSTGSWYGFATVVVANSMVLEPRDTIEITAGIIAFDKRFYPKISIYDKEINTGDDGFAHYKLQVASKPGKYFVPVKMNFTFSGKQQNIEKEVEYTVANIQKQ